MSLEAFNAPIRIALVLLAILWTVVVLYQLYRRHAENPDESGTSFFGALRALALLTGVVAIAV